MRAGEQKVRIEIWQNTLIGESEYNEPIYGPAIWKTTWAKIAMRQGREFYENNQVFSLTNYFFTCRYFSVAGITTDMWIIFNGLAYTITNLNPDFGDKDTVVIEARVKNIVAP